MNQYKLYQVTGGEVVYVQRLSDNAFIPFDPGNIDYQRYLSWVAEGNTPEPADPLPEPTSLTPQQKLEAAGLTVPELKQLLGLT